MAYLSTVALYHFFGDVQTEAGAFVAGGEKGVKDMCLCFFIDARTIIYNINVWLPHHFIDPALDMNHDIGSFHVTGLMALLHRFHST